MILARNGLIKALSHSDMPSLTAFKTMILKTGIFTARYCAPPTCNMHVVNEVLRALGAYASAHHDKWMEQHCEEYQDMLPKAIYHSVYLHQAQHGEKRWREENSRALGPRLLIV